MNEKESHDFDLYKYYININIVLFKDSYLSISQIICCLQTDHKRVAVVAVLLVVAAFDIRIPPDSAKNVPNTKLVMADNLIKMLIDGPEVSLSGSPTVSPTTAAL